MTSPDVVASGLTLRYGRTAALDGVSFSLEGGKIYGLLGRNGAGKTSLLSVLAGFRRPTGGRLTVAGAEPFENPDVVEQVALVRDPGPVYDMWRVREVLDFAARMRPHWDAAYAERLVERFELPLRKRVMSLSHGKKSALSITVGLAARAPVSAFDEAYLGLDAPSRYAFYDELLADYAAHPRTLIVSTHLIEEVASLFEAVLILDRGRLLLHEDSETLRARGAAVTGPAAAVDRFVDGLTALGERRLGPTKSVTVYGELDGERTRRARAEGLDIGPVPLQDLFVHLTEHERRATTVTTGGAP